MSECIAGVSPSKLAEVCVELYTNGVRYGQPTYSTIYRKELIDDIEPALKDVLTAEGWKEVRQYLDELPDEFSCY